MQLFTFFGLAACLASTWASPSPAPVAEAAKKNFYVKSSVIRGNKAYDNMYVEGYHTGAGTNDATLSTKKAYTAYINNTHLIFNLGSANTIWGTEIPTATQYTSFQPVTINSIDGVGNSGFFINSTGIFGSAKRYGFEGWRVCAWWHYNTPQLFFLTNEGYSPPSCNCADVNLIPEYV